MMNRQPLAAAALIALSAAASAQTASGTSSTVPGSQATSVMPPVSTPTASASGFEAAGIPSSGNYAPASMRLMDGGVMLTPTLGVSGGYNDNVKLRSTNKTGSSFYALSPRLLATSAYRANRFSLGYQAEVIRFPSSSNDNVENQELAATGLHPLDTRVTLNWRAAYQDRYDAAGTTDRTSISGRPDHWRGKTAVVAGRYGATGAKGAIEGELGYFDKKYVNNRATTADADYNSVNAVGRFLMRVAPKTSALVEYRHTTIDYERNTQNLDNVEQRLLVGAQWEATAATSGTFKVGYLNKKYDAVRPTFNGLTWEGGIRWQPLTYSYVDLSTGRGASDPSGGGGNYIKSSFVQVAWVHNWSSYLATKVGGNYNQSDYDGIARKDKISGVSVGVSYDLRRQVRLGAEYQFSRRNSNVAAFDYDRNLYTLMAEFAF